MTARTDRRMDGRRRGQRRDLARTPSPPGLARTAKLTLSGPEGQSTQETKQRIWEGKGQEDLATGSP